ncbi:MAG: hypothetical protein R3C39_10580 [Dehalococcoidia bacterium]
MATWFAAAIGGLADLALGPITPALFTVPLGLVIGLVGTVGLLSFRRNRPLLGLAVGLVVGAAATPLTDDVSLALLGAIVALGFRLIGRWWFGGRDMVELLGERLEREHVPFVAPYSSPAARIGTDWPARTAAELGWAHTHNPRGVGLVTSLEELRGPRFDPDQVAPTVRHFYEHTSDYSLTITPVWNRRAQLLYWLFKQLIASRIGQANLPFTQTEAQRGVVSAIDTLTVPADPPHDLRVWTRSYAANGDALYVGVYTTYLYQQSGFVSVGFPLPKGNFTATLRAENGPGGALFLQTRRDELGHAGHYLSAVESDGRLTVLKVPALDEEIHVFEEAGSLKTEHRFLVWGQVFLSLNYTMALKSPAAAGEAVGPTARRRA